MTVACLLYLSKQPRPDIITVVGFFCTRVRAPTKEDQEKLDRLLGYLTKTKDFKYKLEPKGMFDVWAYVVASFATHEDSKSHAGCVVMVGGVLVLREQKCMTKSPTKAELVGLSDNLSFVEIFVEFVEFIINQRLRVPEICPDNTSIITLVTQRGGVMRTKHLRTRMTLVLKAVQENRVEIDYLPTEHMLADGLTKILEGKEYKIFSRIVLGKQRTG
jgi:hypothetical protein